MSDQSAPLAPYNLSSPKNPNEIKRILEAVLLTSQDPLSLSELRKIFNEEINLEIIRKLLEQLQEEWINKGIKLVHVASGWRFHTKPEIQKFLNKLNPQKPLRYSRSVLEILAIIAYRQPVTRGDIEEIRGVSASGQSLKILELRGWVESIGHRDVPGRPILYATTKNFLDDLGLCSIEELPPLEDSSSLFELEGNIESSSAQKSIIIENTE